MTVQRLLSRYLEQNPTRDLSVESALRYLNTDLNYNFHHNAVQAALREGSRRGVFTRTRVGHEYVYNLRMREPTPRESAPSVGGYTGPLSFGIECEMDFLERHAILRQNTPYEYREVVEALGGNTNPFYDMGGWSGHHDGTVGAEIVSPIFTTFDQASRSFARQWSGWIGRNNETEGYSYVPYFVGANPNGSSSIGHHIHIGRPDQLRLTFTEKKKISDAVIGVYPMILSITANAKAGDVLSTRESVQNQTYSRWVDRLNESIARGSTGTGSDSHYYEISDTHHGTVEFRAQDANVPQVDFTAVFLIKMIGERALRGEIQSPELNYFFWNAYRAERLEGTSQGFSWGKKEEYLERLITLTGDASLTEVSQAIKEVLYLTFVQNKVPVELYDEYVNSSEKKFTYFSKMLTNPDTYFGNFIGITSHDFTEWITEAGKLTKLSDLRRAVPPAPVTIPSSFFDTIHHEIRACITCSGNYCYTHNQHVRPEIGGCPITQEMEEAQRIQEAERARREAEFMLARERQRAETEQLANEWMRVDEWVTRVGNVNGCSTDLTWSYVASMFGNTNVTGLWRLLRESPDRFYIRGDRRPQEFIVEAATDDIFNSWAQRRGLVRSN